MTPVVAPVVITVVITVVMWQVTPVTNKTSPARRVYYDWDSESTNPDYRLNSAFERTSPGSGIGDDEITLVDWALPALVLIGGFFVGRWLLRRRAAKKKEAVVAGWRLVDE